VRPHPNDPRPESLRVHPNSIELLEQVPSSDPEARRSLLERSPGMCTSVEDLKDRQERAQTSLGIVRPKEITGVRIVRKPESDRAEWGEVEKEVLAQTHLDGVEPKPLDYPEVKFLVSWRCDDARCVKPHEMSLLQWGIHELYRKLAGDPERDRKALDRMRETLNEETRDIFLFLGNFRGVMYNFGLMDSYSPKRGTQRTLGLDGA
jgi:hypothetical protein